MKNCTIKRRSTPYIVAHRGVYGANIPCNTLAAFDLAVRQGADVIELDVSMAKDGTLFVFHPGMEHRFLAIDTPLSDMTEREIRALRLVNFDGVPTGYTIPTLHEALSLLKGRAYVNVDKFWTAPGAIGEVIDSLSMRDSVIVKSYGDEKSLDAVERYAPDYMYMAILRHHDDVTSTMKDRNINYIGIEALFDNERDQIISDGYIRSMHDDGYLVWANSIVYNEKDVISAGHTDDISLTSYSARGWKWLIEKQVDFIQTDWVSALREYISSR